MAFLDLIAGKKGENLTSEILKYLLLNSEPFRKKLISRLSKYFAPTDVPQFLNGANCFTEYSSDGFIDVLLIADNAILIIENKLWHSFEPNQPLKYETFIREHAERFGRTADECQVIVLHPHRRSGYVKDYLATQTFVKKPIQLTWKDVQEDLKSVRAESSEMVRVISDLLCEYLDFHIGIYSELNIPRERIIGEAVKLGNQYQRDFLGRISTGFKDKTTNIRFGKTYGGFYFQFSENQSRHHGRRIVDEH